MLVDMWCVLDSQDNNTGRMSTFSMVEELSRMDRLFDQRTLARAGKAGRHPAESHAD